MNVKQQPKSARVLLSAGLIVSTFPLLFKEYVPITDFVHGALVGLGLGMEIFALIIMRRSGRCNTKLSDTEI